MKEETGIGRKQAIESGIVFALIAILTGLITGHEAFYFTASGILVLVIVIPELFKPVAYAWFGFSRLMGWIISRFSLSLIFYLIVIPVGVIRNLTGKDRLQLRIFKKKRQSGWIERNHIFNAGDMKHSF
jgi:hypothetical protein